MNNNKFADLFIMGVLFGKFWSMSAQKSSFVHTLICLQSFQKIKEKLSNHRHL